jgi:hypothetical protein
MTYVKEAWFHVLDISGGALGNGWGQLKKQRKHGL